MRRAFLACVCVVAAGCVSAQTRRLDSVVRPPQAPESVVVFEEAPERPYTTIAHIESKTDAVFKSYEDLRARIIDEAARLGGEAVILGPESTEMEFIILTTGMIPSEKKMLAGEVIIFH